MSRIPAPYFHPVVAPGGARKDYDSDEIASGGMREAAYQAAVFALLFIWIAWCPSAW